MTSEPNVTVIRPELTEEERAERQKKVEKCIADFWLACERRQKKVENCIADFWLAVQKAEQKQRSERNASSDHA